MRSLRCVMLILAFGALAPLARAGQDAAPSSHLVYDDASFDGDILINEVRVPKEGETLYTYYEALGWGGRAAGYAGIQSHPKGRNFIFSIWDHQEHSAPIVALHRGPGTLTEKFGGEGTGLKSWNFELGWETDVWHTLVSRCWPAGDHTHFGFWARSGKTGRWTHLVSMDVAAKQAWFHGGNDSFIEDWLETGKNARSVHLRRGWKRKLDGTWHAFGSARYSVNHWDLEEGKRSHHFRTHWNGGVAADAEGPYYFMISGGVDTMPTAANPSRFSIPREEKDPGFAPLRVLKAKAKADEKGKIRVTWENDPLTSPQFGFLLSARSGPAPGDSVLAEVARQEPHVRSAELEAPSSRPSLLLRVVDVFDRECALPVEWNSND